MKFKSLFAAMLIVALAAGMAFAQEKKIDPYFQVRMFVGMKYVDDTLNGGDSDIDFLENGMITSRLGLKASTDKISGQVELGLRPNSYGNSVYLRHLFATYDNGTVKILFGQTWTPYTHIMGCQTEDFVGIGYGTVYDGRLPQVKVTWKGIYVAAIAPKGIANGDDKTSATVKYPDSDTAADDYATTTTTEYDNYMPKWAIGYEYKSEMLDIGPGFAINYTKVEGGSSVTSFIAYLHGKVKVSDFYTNFHGTISRNPGDFGILDFSIAPLTGNDETKGGSTKAAVGKDFYEFKGFIELGYKLGIGDLGFGVGYVDNFETDDQRIAVFGQLCMPVMKNFKITPTILYVNQLDDQGYEMIAGVKLQADF